ncbi:MAG: hypothetical protein JXR76_31710 [Deltaproteobacteria bacterium]|nr:hypothetical protein [Deltaproteobacteria bacterium]
MEKIPILGLVRGGRISQLTLVYFITRRTIQRKFWLKPTKQTTQIFLYCIAMAAQKTGVRRPKLCRTSAAPAWSNESMRPDVFERLIGEDIARQEKEIADEMRKNGQTFMGMDAVLKQYHKDKPQSREVLRSMNPNFFALYKWLRIDAIKRYKNFVLESVGKIKYPGAGTWVRRFFFAH